MATLAGSNFLAVARPSQLGPRRRIAFTSVPGSSIFSRRVHAARVRAAVQTATPDPIEVDEKVASKKGILACPICYHPLTHVGPALSMDSLSESTLLCSTCKKTYLGNKTHLELVASSGAKEYTEAMAPATEFFRLPLISYIYERGWRQGFSAVGGWPGPQKEFELIKGYLEPVLGGNIIDASCGSGPFTRLFAKSGLFSLVVALDYSENMLRECYEFIEKEENFPKEDLILVRADISRLPFVSSSVDAVHAGAAVHCWSSPSSAVAEISRVLRPGGIFVATTFIYDGPYALNPFSKLMQKNMFRLSGGQFFLSEHELEDLCKTCGLEDFKCTRNRRFVMISATKPS